jgi:hypothetical protein
VIVATTCQWESPVTVGTGPFDLPFLMYLYTPSECCGMYDDLMTVYTLLEALVCAVLVSCSLLFLLLPGLQKLSDSND